MARHRTLDSTRSRTGSLFFNNKIGKKLFFFKNENSSYVVSEGNSGTACDVASNVFNSELGSNYLAHYGLDGPLAEYQPPPSDYGNDAPEEPSEVDNLNLTFYRTKIS